MRALFEGRRRFRPNWMPTFISQNLNKRKRCDQGIHKWACRIAEVGMNLTGPHDRDSLFNWVIMIAIFLNAVTIALETTSLRVDSPAFFDATDGIFLTVYIAEFLIKVYAEPLRYWKNYYNLFDFTILVISVVQTLLSALQIGHTGVLLLRIVRALRTLRILKSISFFKGLQVLVTALIQTFRTSILYLMILLLVLMFLFATMGFNFFGSDPGSDKKHWGTFGSAMLSLFTLVTADGWTDVQEHLSLHGYAGSQLFTIVFIFLGHFIFTNLFIGVIIMNIHSATEAYKKEQQREKETFILEKKNSMLERQHEEVVQLLQKQRDNHFSNFQEMLSEFEKTLRHDDFSYSSDICTSPLWMDTMLTSLQHIESSRFRCQQLQYDLAWCLAQLKEEELKKVKLSTHTMTP